MTLVRLLPLTGRLVPRERRRAIVVIASVVLMVLVASPPANADEPRDEATRALFARWDRPDSPGCSVAVVQAGEIAFADGFGAAHLEHDAPITPGTVFHVASVSKQFVAFAVALLATDGALSLDDDVRRYVPEVPDLGPTITIRHLVHHASGLRDQWDLLTLAGWRMEDVITRDDVMELLAAQTELNFDPGTASLYCNTGYTLLGLVVERVSGDSLDAFCQERMFGPLDMTRTHFHDDHRHLVPGRAECYVANDDGYEKRVLSYAIAGATSLFTTVEDLARWEDNFHTGRVGGPATIALMDDRFTLADGETIAYGMALVHGEHRGRAIRAHAGGDAGFRSYLMRFPDERVSVAILANTPMDTGGLARKVADIWLEAPQSDSQSESESESVSVSDPVSESTPSSEPVSLPRTRLEQLAGRYRSNEPPIAIELTATDAGLDLRIGNQTNLRLVPLSLTHFRVEGVFEGTAEFTETDDDVERVTVEGPMGRFVLDRIVPMTAEDRAAYVGRYTSPELGVHYDVVLRDDALALTRRKHGTVPLVELGPDLYGGPFRMRFERDDAGDVNGLRVTTGRVRNLSFERTARATTP